MSRSSGDEQTRPTIEEELRLRFGPRRDVPPPGLPQFDPPERVLPPFDQPPVVRRELIALMLLIAICDLTIYRGRGYAGFGALFVVAPLLLLVGTVRRTFDRSGWVLAPLLLLLAMRLVWCGSTLAVAVGFALLCGFAMTLSGLRPHVLQAVVFATHAISAGHRGLHHYSQALGRFSPAIFRANWFAIVLPVVTLFAFGTIFVMANPDLVKSFSSGLTWIVEGLERWIESVQWLEILFCIGVGWLCVGLLRPDVRQVATSDGPDYVSVEPVKSPLYEAFRNTLVMVIGLFAVYLVFEFLTLWFRVFPKGFHYSGYAHEGAAWLTVALGLATLMLSVIFRDTLLDDPRLPWLRKLAWAWSVENLLLAAAVFNRLFIYVGFNGMTRMRVIGLLGVASVVVGFLLVVWKIVHNRNFVWLIRRQLWTVSFAAYLYAVLPVDAFVNQYNVRRILAGDPAPSVQISEHPTSSEGLLCLSPLLECSDEIIRDGIRALLDQTLEEAEVKAVEQQMLGWTAVQGADQRLLAHLRPRPGDPVKPTDLAQRAAALERFRKYAYQWY
ncbi:MAG: DUF4173 domain-containing protein [Candidatus Saccharimonas sp.]|nr:DUF4173 domain-containing protein [Planctomycetaceae bacterium]